MSERPHQTGQHGDCSRTRSERISARAGAAGVERVGVDLPRRCTSPCRGTAIRRILCRYANPTVRSFEQAIAELEGAQLDDVDAMAFASGTARWPAPCSPCSAVITSSPHASSTRRYVVFLQGPCRRFGIDVTMHAAGCHGRRRPGGPHDGGAAETPSNPRLELVDLDELGSITGPFTVVDSTFATPSASSHSHTASTSSSTPPPRASPGTTTPRSVSPPNVRSSMQSGYGALSDGVAVRRVECAAWRAHDGGPHRPPVRRSVADRRVVERASGRDRRPLPGAGDAPAARPRPSDSMRQFGTVLALELAGGRGRRCTGASSPPIRVVRRATSLGGPRR